MLVDKNTITYINTEGKDKSDEVKASDVNAKIIDITNSDGNTKSEKVNIIGSNGNLYNVLCQAGRGEDKYYNVYNSLINNGRLQDVITHKGNNGTFEMFLNLAFSAIVALITFTAFIAISRRIVDLFVLLATG
jgi:hypothetical protein